MITSPKTDEDQDMKTRLGRRARGVRRSRRGMAGFSLMELLVAMGMFTVVMVGALLLLDATNRVTRTQIGRADIQQAIRVAQDEMVRQVRMAGRGGLGGASTARPHPTGLAIEMQNNVPVATRLFPTNANSPDIMEDTDVLIVRGIVDSPLFYVDSVGDKTAWDIDLATKTGWLDIKATTGANSFPQDLEWLDEQLSETTQIPEALIMPSAYDADFYGVALVDWDDSSYDDVAGIFRLAFNFENDESAIDPISPSNKTHAYAALSSEGYFPAEKLARSGFKSVGILSEYRYYVREHQSADGTITPKLSRTRTLPNWDELWTRDSNAPDPEDFYEDISNAVVDLQVAYGFSDEDGPTGGEVTDTGAGDDQWYLNSAADGALPNGDLVLLRVTSLARSDWNERNYEAPPILRLEDRTYDAAGLNSPDERRHHRFFLETVIDLRNL